MQATIDPTLIENFDPTLVDWYFGLSTIEQQQFLAEAMAEAEKLLTEPKQPPTDWRDWLPALFPNLFYRPFVARHEEFWGHIDTIQPGVKPPAFFAVWGRGGGKTTNAEAAAVYLGAETLETEGKPIARRKFCLYIRSTQDKANESVQNIGAMLESRTVAEYYPTLAERKLGKYGNSKGWRVDTLRCANGYNVVALGLDAAVRGIKIEEYRPDVIIIDDVDSKDDTFESIQKKIKTLTRDILPAGSSDCAIIGIQNLIHYKGIFTQIVEGRADFLYDRIISGPYPAVDGLEYERDDAGKYHITAGQATWTGQDLATCESQINEWGLTAFLEEAQNLVKKRTGRVYHAFKGPGPHADSLDYSKAEGYWHSHDFGAVNEVWGLWVKIGPKYYLIFEQQLPEGTTAGRAAIVKEKLAGKSIVAGYGGAKGEKQIRLDYRHNGLDIRLPVVTELEAQVRATNQMFEKGELVICSNCVRTIDMLENCVRDDKELIADESRWHYLAQLRYFAAGVGGGLHWAR